MLNETDFHAGDKGEITKFRCNMALSDRSQKDLSGECHAECRVTFDRIYTDE